MIKAAWGVFRQQFRPFIIWFALVAYRAYVVIHPCRYWLIYPNSCSILFALYWLRAKVRVYFGLVELVFGLFVFITSIEKGRGDFDLNFDCNFPRLSISLIVVTAFTAAY